MSQVMEFLLSFSFSLESPGLNYFCFKILNTLDVDSFKHKILELKYSEECLLFELKREYVVFRKEI